MASSFFLHDQAYKYVNIYIFIFYTLSLNYNIINMTDEHFYEMKNGHGLSHDPFKAIVAPRPIGWISTQSAHGHINLAPYSFFNALSSYGYKDCVTNVEQTKEFVYNLATRELAEKVNITSYAAPYGINEMRLAGLEAVPSRLVKAPRVRDS